MFMTRGSHLCHPPEFLSAFCPRGREGGEQNEIVWIIGGDKYMYPCAKHVAN